jgi:hypothetical protein
MSDAARNSDPIWCAAHDLWHNRDEQCWRCASDVAAVALLETGAAEEPREARPMTSDAAAYEPPDMANRFAFAARIRRICEVGAPNTEAIVGECLDLAAFLVMKNKAYGDSALNPVRILSKAGPAEQIRIRIDDKLSRLVRGELAGEDAIQDLVGYYILMKIAEKQETAG